MVDASRIPVHPAAELLPLLDGDDLRELVEDIRRNGLLEPVWMYDDPDLGRVLLDGRNRMRACAELSISPPERIYAGDDPIGFVLSENVKRRHLTTGQKAAIAVQVEPLYAAEATQRKAQRERDERGRLTSGPIVADLRPRESQRERKAGERAAKVAGTSGRAVSQYKRVEAAAPDLAEKVRAGTVTLDRAERVVRDREAERRRVTEARAVQQEPAKVDIREGDFREALADVSQVDAIITDPPYGADFIDLLFDLASWADKALTEDGILAVLFGQTYLPQVYAALDTGRPYRWTACYLTPGGGYASHPRRVQSNWKPLIVYGGGPRFSDVFRCGDADGTAKANHRWGQDFEAFRLIVERLTSPGQVVCDPFMGSGTTLLAAHTLGRHAIGCDVDPESVRTARERLL